MNISIKNLWPVILGMILLIPFGALFAIGLGGQILNIIGVQNSWNQNIGNLIGNHVRFANIVILIPVIAAVAIGVIFFIYIVSTQRKEERIIPFIGSIVITIVGLGMLILLFGHDSVPCFVKGIAHQGFHNLKPLIDICRNA